MKQYKVLSSDFILAFFVSLAVRLKYVLVRFRKLELESCRQTDICFPRANKYLSISVFILNCIQNFQLQTLEDKLNWIFDVFDRDGGGTIDPAELRDIVHGLFCLAGIEAPEEILDVRSKVSRLKINFNGWQLI